MESDPYAARGQLPSGLTPSQSPADDADGREARESAVDRFWHGTPQVLGTVRPSVSRLASFARRSRTVTTVRKAHYQPFHLQSTNPSRNCDDI